MFEFRLCNKMFCATLFKDLKHTLLKRKCRGLSIFVRYNNDFIMNVKIDVVKRAEKVHLNIRFNFKFVITISTM